jgi:hypothetical protein
MHRTRTIGILIVIWTVCFIFFHFSKLVYGIGAIAIIFVPKLLDKNGKNGSNGGGNPPNVRR